MAESEEGALPGYKKISKASVKYAETIRIRLGADKELVIEKEGDDYYLLEPARANEKPLGKCHGAIPLLNGANVVIGRQELAAECLNLPEAISRQHLLIKREFDTFYLFDLHSKNGTYLGT